MNLSQVFTAVIAANIVTVAFLYACWRMNRDNPGVVGPAIALVCSVVAVMAGIASR